MLWISLPKYTTVGPRLREELREARRVAFVGQPLVAVPRVRRILPRLLEQSRERLLARQRPELVDVDARRNLVHAVDVTDDVLEHRADVRRADEDRLRARERLTSPGGELLVAAHRVLELGAVRLDHVARAGRRSHRPSGHDVVREDDVRRKMLAQRRRVELDVTVTLGPRQLGKPSRLQPLVTVEDEDRQDAADVRTHELRTAEVVDVRMPLLREQHDLVAGAAPLPRERARVDVRARAAQEVPVPEKDSQVRWK